MNTDLLKKILARHEVLILVRDADGLFRPEGLMPDWFASFGGDAITGGGRIEPGKIFAFLEHFLPEAEPLWAKESSEEISSGFWAEGLEDGSEIHLKAVACFLAGKALLIVRRIELEFDQMQRALQRGREISITHERLLSETNKKEILLYCIVHDLSGPLSGITGALDILRNENLGVEARRFLELGRLGVRQQANFINDLLDSFKAEMGSESGSAVDPSQAPDLLRCAREVINTLKPAYAVREVECRLVVAADLQARQRVVGEWNRLLRVMHNLLQNALRYSSARGVVTMTIARDAGEILVAVDDEGPGIPPDVVPQLFQKFVRGRGNQGKAGLGLFFCRITLEQWGGTIGCLPRKNGGTRFWFRLKAA